MDAHLWPLVAGALGLLLLGAAVLRGRAAAAARKAVRLAVEEHAPALARRRAQLIRIDDYGVEIDKAWRKEMAHFFEKVILPRVGPAREGWALERRPEILELVDATARRERQAPRGRAAAEVASSGIDFELECQEILAEHGWSARLTQASGDQGADIIAEAEDGLSVAIQCKRLARPVGNKAVQEVVAARTYYDTDLAAVVSTGDYTEAARRLARRNDVHLLHVDDLPELETGCASPATEGRGTTYEG
jgi:restriction system protein